MPLAELSISYEDAVVESGNQPTLLMLVAFAITFGITRFVTHSIRAQRFSWLSDVEAGGTHIHHLVWGICLLLLSGLLAIAVQPPLEVTAVVFGIGAALTLDEFALWLHLEDVYWSEQGRQSVDAVIVFALLAGLMGVGGFPIVIGSDASLVSVLLYLALEIPFLGLAVICFMKGKLIWGVIGIYLWPVALIGALRLARPRSWWVRHRYDDARRRRSDERYGIEAEVHKPATA